MKMVFRVSDLATQFGMAKSMICTILKNRETIKKADVARGVTVITKQRSQTIEEVTNLCTKYGCKSLNKQSSGVQLWINPYYINSYGENSFGLRTFQFTNDLQERIKFVNRGLTVLSFHMHSWSCRMAWGWPIPEVKTRCQLINYRKECTVYDWKFQYISECYTNRDVSYKDST